MSQPFDPLISATNFRTTNAISVGIRDAEIVKFLKEAAKVFYKAGTSISLNGNPKLIVEESQVKRIGRSIESLDAYGYDTGPFGYSYLTLSQPILSLTEVAIKDQSVNPAVFTQTIPVTDFQFQKNQKWIQSSTGILSNPFYFERNITRAKEGNIVRITYTTGITDSISDIATKSDINELLSYLWDSHGIDLQVNQSIGDRQLSEFRSDDTAYKYANPGGFTVGEYFDDNPYFLGLLSKYIVKNDKHFF